MSVIAVYGGGFKPPTRGHYEVVKQTLENYPEIDELKIIIGNKERDGVTQDEALQIWDIYNDSLPIKVKLEPSSEPPIKRIYNIAKENPEDEIYWVLGTREGNEQDELDIELRTRNLDKYPNLQVKKIETSGGASGTKMRNALGDKDEFLKYVPDEVEDKESVYDVISEKKKKLNEGKQVGNLYHYTSKNNLDNILELNKLNNSEEEYLGNELYYVSFTRNKNFHKKGQNFEVNTDYRITLDGDKLSNRYKIKPFAYMPGWNYTENFEYDWLEDEDESTRRDFFDATGDYDEQEERISFKNSEGNISNIKDYILSVDKVSTLNEKKKELGIDAYALELQKLREGLFTKKWWYSVLTENKSAEDLRDYIVSLTKHMENEGLELSPYPKVKFIHNDNANAKGIFGKTAYYNPEDNSVTLYTLMRHPKDILRSYAHELIHAHQNNEGRLHNITTTNTNEDDQLVELEKEAYEKGNIMFRNWTDSITNG